jgi:hypothetical protein
MKMELNHLKTFFTLARAKSFTKAAGLLFVSQSAVSHSIKKLESSVNAQLILRKGKTLISFRKHPMMNDDQRQAMLKKIGKIRDQIKGGKPFADMARESSQDKATAHKGGDLGWIRKGAMGPKFTEAAFGLKSGQVSEPVETAFGYHLITVIEPPRSVKRPFKSVAGAIRNRIKLEATAKETERLLSSVKVKLP